MKILILSAALLLALYTAATAKDCRVVSEPTPTPCQYFTPSGKYLCDKDRCIELVAPGPSCRVDRIACDGDLPKEARE